jgi:acetylornithine deacetylase/succinyl-diaminopimelate desuccinylase-like protein
MMELGESMKPPKDGKVIFAFTVAEEGNLTAGRFERGSQYAVEKYTADACIVLEPTMYSRKPSVSVGCRGRTVVDIDIIGKSTHSSRPYRGLNPIDEAQKLMNTFNKEKLRSARYFKFELNETLSVVRVHADAKATNIIPDNCEMTVDYRTLSGRKDGVQRINQMVKEAKIEAKVKPIFSSPGYILDRNYPIVKLAEGSIKNFFYKQPKLTVALGRADAEYFFRKGTPTIICGPGENMQCHKPNEHLWVPDLVKMTKAIEQMCKRFLKQKKRD